jgi:phage/plasmid-associated DNA primase
MSKLEQEIIESAAITIGTGYPVKDIKKIIQVMVSCKLQGTAFTPAMLKKLLKRYEGEPGEDEIKKLYADANETYAALIEQRKAEKSNIIGTTQKTTPGYVYEGVDRFGDPNGTFYIDYVKYADFLHTSFRVHNLSKNLFIYDETTGIYYPHTNEIETHVRRTFKDFSISGKLYDCEREIMAHIMSMGCVHEYPFTGAYGTIHVLNGCLDLRNGELVPTTPDMLYDYRIGTEYREFSSTPELDMFLSQYGTTEPIDVLAKALWQRAFQDTVKELTIFIGPKDCGKTTCSELIQCTLEGDLQHRSNVGRTLLHELLQRFGYSGLQGKLLNLGDDLPDAFVKNANRINELLGSVVRHIEKKGIDGYDAIVTAYHLFTTNSLPPLDDDDSIIWGKIHLVEFNNTVPNNRVPRMMLFTEVLKQQLLYRAVEKASGYVKIPYTNPQSADSVRRAWHESSTDVDAFLAEATMFEPSSSASLDEIKKHYESWCVYNRRKRYIKHLNYKLKPYFRRLHMNNVYCLKLLDYKSSNSQSPLFANNPMQSVLG